MVIAKVIEDLLDWLVLVAFFVWLLNLVVYTTFPSDLEMWLGCNYSHELQELWNKVIWWLGDLMRFCSGAEPFQCWSMSLLLCAAVPSGRKGNLPAPIVRRPQSIRLDWFVWGGSAIVAFIWRLVVELDHLFPNP